MAQSRKRWRSIYADANPFELPQKIQKQIRHQTNGGSKEKAEPIRYLWIVLKHEAEAARTPKPRSLEDWLNLIDEATSLGVKSLILTCGNDVSDYPYIWELCTWAQASHGLRVGLHFSEPACVRQYGAAIRRLEASKTFVFVPSESIEALRREGGEGLALLAADGPAPRKPDEHCNYPAQMACASASGGLYTCGRVLDEEQFFLGEADAVRLDRVLADASLPHQIDGSNPSGVHRCAGCPPLMEQRMRAALQ